MRVPTLLLLAELLCALSCHTLAFRPVQRHNARIGPSALSKRARSFHHAKLYSVNEERAMERISPSPDPDRVRRRQLLFSILASASAIAAARPEGAKASPTVLATDAVSTALDVIVPPLDDREYATYTLRNGLRVLLCSDPSSNDAAAAMDVHVGACSDPREIPGLAHFNEHMLFLGTKKYPKEDSFEAFLAANGGSSNAYTDTENTVYYFEMEAEADNRIAEGLSRFGSFFTEPLFTESATGRELNAIESENAKNLQSDTFRTFQINKSRANSQHPFSKFFTGNKKTLLDDTVAQGIDLREELKKFYDRYYSANQMTLAIVAPQSIEKLRKMVDEAFGEVPNKNVPKPEEGWMDVPPYLLGSSIIPSFYHVVEIVPVQDLRQVTIAWPILYRTEQDRVDALFSKPTTYVAHLLGHEGPGSLLSYLKRRGWANSVAAADEEELSDFQVFEIVVGLTTQGLRSVNKVVEAVYSYIDMLRERKIPDYVFSEVLQLDELQWRFATKGNAGSYAQSIATAMQKYPSPLYIAGPRRLALDGYESDPLSNSPRMTFSSPVQLARTRDLAEKMLKYLTVENALLTILSKTFENGTDRKELWYGTDYRARRLDEETLNAWRKPESGKRLKIDFPMPNPFIPSEDGLQVKVMPAQKDKNEKRSFESRMEPLPPPQIIRDDGRWTVYYKQDDRFGKPKAYIVFQVMTKEVYSSAFRASLASLFETCVADRIGEYAYDANLAGLIYEVKVLPRGVRLTFGGYNDKLKKFASYISRKLTSDLNGLLPKNDQEFERYKDQIMRTLSAFDVKQPYAHAAYYGQLTLQPEKFQYTIADLQDSTRKITLPDLIDYIKSIWSSGKGEALVQGNYNEQEALEMVNAIGDVLPFRPIPESEYPPRHEALPLPILNANTLPPRLVIAEPNPANENAVSYLIIQNLGKTEKDHVLIEILNAILQEPFYNELRTKRQLGYVVSSGVRGIGSSRTISFIVQSSIAPSDSLTIEILKFLDTVEETYLKKLSKGDFEVYVKSLIDRKTEPDKDLSMEVTRNWSEIASGRFQFDRIQREAAALLELEKEDLLNFWRRIYVESGRRILITEMVPRIGPASSDPPPPSTGRMATELSPNGFQLGIDDIEQFRHQREFYML